MQATTPDTVPVLLPLALPHPYDYALPPGMRVAPGDFVVAPLGVREYVGVVWRGRLVEGRPPVDPAKLRAVVARIEEAPPLPAASIAFVEWVSHYTLASPGMVLRMVIGSGRVLEQPPERLGCRLAGPPPARITPARARVLALAADGLVWAKTALAEAAGVSVAVIDGLVAAGTLAAAPMPPQRFAPPDPDFHAPELTSDQSAAAAALQQAVLPGGFSVTLLDGVTGAGKTEVYFEAVAAALRAGRQALILMPEIALTGQFIDRFAARFGTPPAEWHSELGAASRARVWRAVASGEARVVVGARSALFLPFTDLGLIVVDEEHDAAYKQEDRVIYHGRDMAVVRGSLGGCPVILSSATPSVESHVNARSGRYRHIRLPERYAGAGLPDITAIDMRKAPPERGAWLSPALIAAVNETLDRGQQAMLFLNRRGYAPLTLCRACGYRFECPQCSAWLVEHRFRRRLECHHCGYAMAIPEACPSCAAEEALVACGPGVERIAEEAAERWPAARRVILSSDLVPNVAALREVLATIAERRADIVIGTQLVAKGHHFPGLATVGVVDADLGLGLGDPRAAERTYQLLYQVTGRAGRAHVAGRGFVQTYMPEHPVIRALIHGDRDLFLETEIDARRRAGYPPFGRLAALIVSAPVQHRAQDYARRLALAAPPAAKIKVLGPAEAPLAVIRGRHRFRLLVKAAREADLQAYVRAWLEQAPAPKGGVRLVVDVDPYNFL